jgi:hypothetical protein
MVRQNAKGLLTSKGHLPHPLPWPSTSLLDLITIWSRVGERRLICDPDLIFVLGDTKITSSATPIR